MVLILLFSFFHFSSVYTLFQQTGILHGDQAQQVERLRLHVQLFERHEIRMHEPFVVAFAREPSGEQAFGPPAIVFGADERKAGFRVGEAVAEGESLFLEAVAGIDARPALPTLDAVPLLCGLFHFFFTERMLEAPLHYSEEGIAEPDLSDLHRSDGFTDDAVAIIDIPAVLRTPGIRPWQNVRHAEIA